MRPRESRAEIWRQTGPSGFSAGGPMFRRRPRIYPADMSEYQGGRISDAHIRERVRALVQNIEVAMLTTVTEDGRLRSRPMATRLGASEEDLWFFVRDESAGAWEAARESQVGLTYVDTSNQTYLSISGTAAVGRDAKRAARLWSDGLARWFPLGLSDPHLALMRVRIDTVELWEGRTGRMINLLELIAAPFSGVSADLDPRSPGGAEKRTDPARGES